MGLSTTHLITRALLEGDISPLRRLNVKVYNEVDATYINWILNHTAKYYSIPNLDVFKDNFPEFIPHDYDAALDYIFDTVSKDVVDKYILRKLAAEKRPSADLVRELAEDTKIISGNSIIYNEVDPAIYFTDKQVLSCDVPFVKQTLGNLVSTDFLLFVGRGKGGKTHTSQVTAINLLQYHSGIVGTNEITAEQYAAKLDAIIAGTFLNAGFNPRIFRSLDVDERVKEALKLAREYRLTKLKPLKIISGVYSIQDLYSIKNNNEFPVDFIILDGMHLMGGQSGTTSDKAQSMRNISNGAKQFALQTHTALIGVSQSGRGAEGKEKPGSDTVALTDAFHQDVTALWNCRTEAGNYGDKVTLTNIYPIISREGVEGDDRGTWLYTDWNTTFCEWKINKEDVAADEFFEDELDEDDI